MARLKVLISGAGIAGNALAFWLLKLGHDVTVVERFPSLRTTGLQIDLRGHGIEVLKRMGLEGAFRSKAAPEQGLQAVDSSGRRRAYFPANKSGKGRQSLTSDFEIMRGDLCRLFYEANKSRAKYMFGTSIEGFEEKSGGVGIRFADGKMDRFDLLVGADGQWSRTRRIMLGTDTPDAFYPVKDLYMGYFTSPQPIKEGEGYIATGYIGPGRRGIMTRRSNPHEIQIYLTTKTDSIRLRNARRGDAAEEKAAFAEIFQGAGWQTDAILESLKDADDFYCERLGLVKMEAWSRSRVTLVGDAAYCPSALTGMGTTSGIVGAYILAGEIGRHCGRSGDIKGHEDCDAEKGLVNALEAYERTFRPFMDQVQKGVGDDSFLSEIMWPSSPFGIGVLNCIVGIASFLRLDVIASSFLRESVKGWDLPEYKEMLGDRVGN